MTSATGASGDERTTAPQSPYSMREAGIGFAIFAVALGLLVLLALLV